MHLITVDFGVSVQFAASSSQLALAGSPYWHAQTHYDAYKLLNMITTG